MELPFGPKAQSYPDSRVRSLRAAAHGEAGVVQVRASLSRCRFVWRVCVFTVHFTVYAPPLPLHTHTQADAGCGATRRGSGVRGGWRGPLRELLPLPGDGARLRPELQLRLLPGPGAGR